MDFSETHLGPFEWREAPAADYAVIGDPIHHSKSPTMHMAAYKECNLAMRYVAIRVPESDFETAVEHLTDLGYRGLNVTIPHKEKAFGLGFQGDDFTHRVRASNTLDLQRKRAINTDGPGFVEVLKNCGVEAPKKILMLGAGGSARALAFAIAEAGHSLAIWNRTQSKAEALAEAVGSNVRVSCNLDSGDYDIIVNATSVGLKEGELPVQWEKAEQNRLAVDLVYGQETTFLSQARSAGWITEHGKSLLVAQGALSFEFWLGQEAPREVMRKALDTQ